MNKNTIKIGMVFKLNPKTDKSDWDFTPNYNSPYILKRIYTTSKNKIKYIIHATEGKLSGIDWEMHIDFFNKHFIRMPITNWRGELNEI